MLQSSPAIALQTLESVNTTPLASSDELKSPAVSHRDIHVDVGGGAGNTNGSSPSKEQVFEAQLGDRIAFFKEHIVLGDGNCGFTTLGVSRDHLVEKLLAMKADSKAREDVCEEIQAALIRGDWKPNGIEWQSKWNEYQKQCQLLDAAMRAIKQTINSKVTNGLEVDGLIILLGKAKDKAPDAPQLESEFIANSITTLQKLRLDVFNAKRQWDDCCSTSPVFEAYITTFRSSAWLGRNSALLYAKAANINLYIWQKILQIHNN